MGTTQKLTVLLLSFFILLSLAACGGGVDANPDETKITERSQTETGESTEPSTTAPRGELVETAHWNLRYDPELWFWEDDALSQTDHRSMLTMTIPDPEDDDEDLVWFRVRAMDVSNENFRGNLRANGFDLYEYAVNNAYATVSIGGLEFLWHAEGDYTIYFTRVFSAGVDVEIEISGEVSHRAVADVLGSLIFTIDEGDNTDPPWYWEGTPYAVDSGEAVVGNYTLRSEQIPFAYVIVTDDTFGYNMAMVDNAVFIISGSKISSYSYDGQTLHLLSTHDLGENYEFAEPADDGTVWCSGLTAPLIRWDGSKIMAFYEDAKYVAMDPDGTWGLSWFAGSCPLKLTFAEGIMTAEEVALPEVASISHARIDRSGNLFVCGSAESDDSHRVFVYNKNMELQATLEGDGSSDLSNIIFATATKNGFLLVDGNMGRIILYTRSGRYIGDCDLNQLCGTNDPWVCDAGIAQDGSILVLMVDQRQDQSADELVAFKISGF